MSKKLRVGVIFGGRSGEHEVSLASATAVIAALDKSKYDIVPIGITKSGRWLTAGDPLASLKNGQDGISAPPVYILADPSERALTSSGNGHRGGNQKLDVVIPIVHGPMGEDGTLQGLLEMADIPYVGAGVMASAVGMDKGIMKAIFRERQLPIVDYRVFLRSRWRQDPEGVMDEIEQALGYPCFIKPVCLGSSVGISKAHDRSELPAALDLAADYDRKIIVEQSAEGYREVECSVLGNDDPVASIPGEIKPAREFYDYHSKYVDDNSQLLIPARLDAEGIRRVQQLAIEAFKALDCCGMSRVDFFVSQDGSDIIVNEVNTIPGFTNISMYPKLWEASGLPMPSLLDRLIELALERHEDKSSSRTSYS